MYAKERLIVSSELNAHLRELDGVMDAQSIARLTKLEHYGTFTRVEFVPKGVILYYTPHIASKRTKAVALDGNGVAQMVQALHGFIYELSPVAGAFKLYIKV